MSNQNDPLSAKIPLLMKRKMRKNQFSLQNAVIGLQRCNYSRQTLCGEHHKEKAENKELKTEIGKFHRNSKKS